VFIDDSRVDRRLTAGLYGVLQDADALTADTFGSVSQFACSAVGSSTTRSVPYQIPAKTQPFHFRQHFPPPVSLGRYIGIFPAIESQRGALIQIYR
jgi:hypothetical protein